MKIKKIQKAAGQNKISIEVKPDYPIWTQKEYPTGSYVSKDEVNYVSVKTTSSRPDVDNDGWKRLPYDQILNDDNIVGIDGVISGNLELASMLNTGSSSWEITKTASYKFNLENSTPLVAILLLADENGPVDPITENGEVFKIVRKTISATMRYPNDNRSDNPSAIDYPSQNAQTEGASFSAGYYGNANAGFYPNSNRNPDLSVADPSFQPPNSNIDLENT